MDSQFADGLVGCWLFNDKPDATGLTFDISGYEHHGTLVANTHSAPGRFGNCLDFHGSATSDYVEISNPGNILDGKHLTIVAWIHWDQDANLYPRIVDRVYNGQFAFYCTDVENKLTWSLSTTGGDVDYEFDTDTTCPQGSWACVGLTYDGSDARIYVDGLLKDTYGIGISGGLSTSTDNIRIGERVDGGTARGFDGQIDHVLIYDRALSSGEILKLYQDPFWGFRKNEAGVYHL